jgi:hypothetical protein
MRLTKRYALMTLIACCTVFGQANSSANASNKTAVKPIEKPVDYSALTAFKGVLLDLKAVVEVGVNRDDYQHRLQAASAESLKAGDVIPDGDTPLSNRFDCLCSGIRMMRHAQVT